MEVRKLNDTEVLAAHRFLCAQGWAHRVGDAERFTLLIQRSQRVVVAIEDREIVGFARGITDGLSNGYLSMVAVKPEKQRRGIGTALVQHLTGANSEVTWVLRSGREGAVAFFERLGFHVSAVAMERPRELPGLIPVPDATDG